jgi:hypothetical protein
MRVATVSHWTPPLYDAGAAERIWSGDAVLVEEFGAARAYLSNWNGIAMNNAELGAVLHYVRREDL